MLVLNFLIALVWAGLVGEFTVINLVIGLVIGFFSIQLVGTGPKKHAYQAKASFLAGFLVFYVKEVIVATVAVAVAVVRPLRYLQPAVLSVPLKPGARDLEVAAIAHLITYTPGSLALEVAPGNTHLFVHVFRSKNPTHDVAQMQGNYERRVLELFR